MLIAMEPSKLSKNEKEEPMIPKEQSPKFIQITATRDITGQETLYAIDEIGNVWEFIGLGWSILNMQRMAQE